jgi:DNA-binding transcriptional regulator YiaG
MTDLDVLRQAHLLLGQYGFMEEQETVAKAIRIIIATSRRLGVAANDRPSLTTRETVGDRVKRLRERAGLSRGQFADMCEIHTSTVRSHENNQTPISDEAAAAYATALGTSVAVIQRGRD